MDPDQAKKLLKRIAIVGGFFLLAVAFYALGWIGVLRAFALIVAVLMVLAILLQSGRGGGLASLGGLGGDSLLGTRSATPVAKATYVMGALVLFICMLVARAGQLGIGQGDDVLIDPDRPAEEQPLELPGAGGAPPPYDADTEPAPEGAGGDDAGTEIPDPTGP